MNFAGFPPTIVNGSTDFVTTLPGKTIALSPISIPGITSTFAKIKTLSPIFTGLPFVSRCDDFMLCPRVYILVSCAIAALSPIFIPRLLSR